MFHLDSTAAHVRHGTKDMEQIVSLLGCGTLDEFHVPPRLLTECDVRRCLVLAQQQLRMCFGPHVDAIQEKATGRPSAQVCLLRVPFKRFV